MKTFFRELISATQGEGPSSTRFVYLVSSLVAALCGLLMTVGGVVAYCRDGTAESSYWAAVVALWTAKLGICGWAKTEQQKKSAEITLKRIKGPMLATAAGD